MIKKNELRIGNLVIYEKTTHKILEINENSSISTWIGSLEYDEENIYHHFYSQIEPIALTEEWLINFGFKIKFDDPILIATFGINPINKDFLITLKNSNSEVKEDYWYYGNGFFQIKYVHQLQNLYFSLIGNELEFNPH